MVSSMVVLAAAEDDDTTDVLVGAYVDAELVYAHSAAIVQAASRSHGSEMVDLKRGFDADGEVALRSRVVEARARVHDINEQVEAGFQQRTPPQQRLDVGAAVEVRNRFVGTWSHGFEVADHIEEGFLIRRVSDRAVLPEVISHDQIRSDSRN
jgi:hypothetical protein